VNSPKFHHYWCRLLERKMKFSGFVLCLTPL
jgi:hypothetical protein